MLFQNFSEIQRLFFQISVLGGLLFFCQESVAERSSKNGIGKPKAAWITLDKKQYCATPDRSIYFRSEMRDENIYLKVRTKSSVEVEYFLWDESETKHVYKRIVGNAVNFPLYIEMTQLFRHDDEILFKEQSGRVLREFSMRFSHNLSKTKACQ